jgi:ABC-type sugar transport system ATPase subunit
MSVAENIFSGREPDRMGFLDYKKLYRQTEELWPS